ncbi:hypothetical protein ABTK15_21260, partial [Acinetobacter baumannii]
APADLYAQPATAFAARFIGTPPMNLLPLQAHAQGLAIAGSNVVLHELGQTPLQLGLRPEHIRLAAASEATAPALVE